MPFDNPHQTPFGDADLLRDARSRISGKSDWVQRRFQDGNRYCLVAAQLPSRVPLWARMRCFTARQRLIWFNDSPRTKHEDVMALFDRTIDHLTRKAPAYMPA